MSNNTESFPSTFYCPITTSIMTDPVIDIDGNSFEKSAITEWILKNGTSPITRRNMTIENLVPNRALKDAIEAAVFEKTMSAGIPETVSEPMSIVENDTDSVVFSGNLVAVPFTSKHDSSYNECNLVATSTTSDTMTRESTDICSVVDISGSMSTTSKIRDEDHGMSVLDIVKHAVRTVAHSLTSRDRLSVVTYSSTAKPVLNLTSMDDAGRATLHSVLDSMCVEGSTNLWDGLLEGLDNLYEFFIQIEELCNYVSN